MPQAPQGGAGQPERKDGQEAVEVSVPVSVRLPMQALQRLIEDAIARRLAGAVLPSQDGPGLEHKGLITVDQLQRLARLIHTEGEKFRDLQKPLGRGPRAIALSLYRWVLEHVPEADELDIDRLLDQPGQGGARVWNYLMARWGRRLPLPEDVKAALPRGKGDTRELGRTYALARRCRRDSPPG